MTNNNLNKLPVRATKAIRDLIMIEDDTSNVGQMEMRQAHEQRKTLLMTNLVDAVNRQEWDYENDYTITRNMATIDNLNTAVETGNAILAIWQVTLPALLDMDMKIVTKEHVIEVLVMISSRRDAIILHEGINSEIQPIAKRRKYNPVTHRHEPYGILDEVQE
tara:strand:- start:2713 stop:3201 length:489 start_codon:yes stop_codon:yes gene_type:complete